MKVVLSLPFLKTTKSIEFHHTLEMYLNSDAYFGNIRTIKDRPENYSHWNLNQSTEFNLPIQALV